MRHVDYASLFRLDVTIPEYNYKTPWVVRRISSGGTGFAIRSQDSTHIATAAHVVASAFSIEVSQPERALYSAGVIRRVGHDVDLALLAVPQEFGDNLVVPKDYERPNPGCVVSMHSIDRDKSIRITQGVLLNECLAPLAYSRRTIQTLQVSVENTSIHPNSGSPAYIDGRLIGAVSQLHGGAIVITPIKYLKRLSSTNEFSLPDLGILWQELATPQLRRHLGMEEGDTGVLVTSVIAGSASFGHLLEGDIVTSIQGIQIGNDGRLNNTDGTHFISFVSDHNVGDTIEVSILRRGRAVSCPIRLCSYAALVQSSPSAPPSYVVFAGLVFVTLTYEMLSENGLNYALHRYKHAYFDMHAIVEGEEKVVLANVISNDATRGYESMHSVFVTEINGVRVTRLSDIRRASLNPTSGRHVIIVDNPGTRAVYDNSSYGNVIVLDAEQAMKSTRELATRGEVPRSHLIPVQESK